MPELTLITGASSDIGIALVRHLLQTTDRTIVAHPNRGTERLQQLQQEFGERLIPAVADLSEEAATLAFAAQVLSLGRPAAFVHLPALRPKNERFTKFDWKHFEADLSVQVRSAILILGKLLPQMTKTPHARVVFMLSSYVHGVPPKYTAMYVVAKYAQLGLLRSLAAEYGATELRVNGLSPSMVETGFLSEISELAVQGAAAAHPLKRNAVPQDLLGTFDLLLSPASDYINGIVIPVAGGISV